MTIVEALKISDVIRRKDKPSHVGSGGDGWVHIDYLLGRFSFLYDDTFPLSKEDLLADDWEARGQE